jgi:hypothetical protein
MVPPEFTCRGCPGERLGFRALEVGIKERRSWVSQAVYLTSKMALDLCAQDLGLAPRLLKSAPSTFSTNSPSHM